MKNKTKIVLDADVVIHFIKGECLSMLHEIFPNYQYIILDIVLEKELEKQRATKTILDNYLSFFDHIQVEKWNPNYEMTKEFSALSKRYGLGESATLAYCKYNHEVIASSNITEITTYCVEYDITYITTMDFIHRAYKTNKLTEVECDEFISKVKIAGSKLPVNKIREYTPREILL